MANKETPPGGGTSIPAPELRELSTDLAKTILASMREWAFSHDRMAVTASLPISALYLATLKLLQDLPPDIRRRHTENFAKSLLAATPEHRH